MKNKLLFEAIFSISILLVAFLGNANAQDVHQSTDPAEGSAGLCGVNYPIEINLSSLKAREIQSSLNIYQDASFQRILRCVVGEDHYRTIIGNASKHAIPSFAKDGSFWIAAGDTQFSPLLFANIHRNGKMYVLFHERRTAKLMYFTNDALYADQLTPLVAAVAHMYPLEVISYESIGKPTLFNFDNKSATSSNRRPKSISADPSPKDAKDLKKFAASVFRDRITNSWNYNEAVWNDLSQVFNEIQQCAKAMSGLPKLPVWQPGWFYIVDSLRRILETILDIQHSIICSGCEVTAANNWVTIITLDSEGVLNRRNRN